MALWLCSEACSAVGDHRIALSESVWLGSQEDFSVWCDHIHLTQSWWCWGECAGRGMGRW